MYAEDRKQQPKELEKLRKLCRYIGRAFFGVNILWWRS